MDFPVIKLEDNNAKCTSVMATMPLSEYLDLVEEAYKDQGGLTGQRAPIKTKTGLKIRDRLVEDLKNGAIIPPIVIGAVVNSESLDQLTNANTSSGFIHALKTIKTDLSIIDGMQRTTALRDAQASSATEPYVRVEFWLARKIESLIYRMLVLNTGQVPWDLKRQLDTLYRPLVSKIIELIPGIRVIGLDEKNRRSQSGEYRSTRVIELFLAFTSRSIDVDIRERVAEDFVKIDITEATSQADYFPLFVETLRLMSDLDAQFDRVPRGSVLDPEGKIKAGRDIFTSSPASIGFVVAVAEKLFGPPGFDYKIDDAKQSLLNVKENVAALLVHMSKLNEEDLVQFVDLDTLNQVLSVKSSRIGEYERALYKRAFIMLLERAGALIRQRSISPCWQSR